LSDTTPVLSVRDLTVSYAASDGAIDAVRGVDLDVRRGEVLGLAGESGCGKSTIAGALLRLLPITATVGGEVLLEGEDVVAMPWGRLRAVRWDRASIVFQGALHGLDPVKTVGDQIAEAILIHDSGETKRSALQRARELIELVRLPGRRVEEYPHELSGGQRQRIMIAMALACDPALVIADEPTTALDVMVQAQILELLRDLQTELGLSMLFITHDLSVLVDICDRISIMYAGRIVETGPAEEVFLSPRHPYTRALGGAFPEIGDEGYRYHPAGLAGDPPDPRELSSGCVFHPRCPEAMEACSVETVDLWPAGEGRSAACLLVRQEEAGR